ncbi:hypothetical protein FBU59_003372 [Linderina macrospora]|uniref:Uncharacterized protein n=1 Tax=Linderina macrospora TaxID=4868 RepID=A0ACC1J8M6_9FUNG|nr:hypothetical protein FBU59_003372 [Linderina macrospora]
MTELPLEEQCAQDFHANPDQRLPSWDLELHVTCGVLRHYSQRSFPMKTDEEIDSIDFDALHDEFRHRDIPESFIPEDQGTAKPLSIDTSTVDIDTTKLKGMGVGEKPLIALVDKDTEQSRQLPYEMVVSWKAADSNGIPRDSGSLTEPTPLYSDERVILYLHGGSFTHGSPGSHRTLVWAISVATNLRALVLDYRLVPRNPFPAQLHDAYIAYLYLCNQGFKAENVFLVGDNPDIQVTELVQENSKYDYVHPYMIDNPAAAPRLFYKPGHRLTDALRQEMRDPYVSPVHGDFADFPPTLIQAGEREILLEGMRTMHQRMKEANGKGANIVYEEYADMVHVFHRLPFRPEAGQAIKAIGRFIASL